MPDLASTALPDCRLPPHGGNGLRRAIRWATALLALTTLPAAGRAQETSAPPTGGLVGRIVGPDGGPQENVLVLAGDHERTTGHDGRFRFDSIPAAVYGLELYHPDRGRATARAPVTAGHVTGLRLRFRRDGGLTRTLSLGGLPTEAATRSESRAPAEAGESRIVGRLVDRSTGAPIESAVVRLPSRGLRTETSGRGRFTFDSLAAGTHTVRIHHVRYGEREVDVDVPADRTVDLDVRMSPDPVEVEPVEVTVDAEVRAPSLEQADYYRRRRWSRKTGYGHFLEAGEIDDRGGEISHVLSSVPQLTASGPTGIGGRVVEGLVYFPRYMEGPFTGCLPAVYLDGHKVVGSGGVDQWVGALGPKGINSLVVPSAVAGVEVYESPAATAGEFQGSDSRCGVVAIWTKRR